MSEQPIAPQAANKDKGEAVVEVTPRAKVLAAVEALTDKDGWHWVNPSTGDVWAVPHEIAATIRGSDVTFAGWDKMPLTSLQSVFMGTGVQRILNDSAGKAVNGHKPTARESIEHAQKRFATLMSGVAPKGGKAGQTFEQQVQDELRKAAEKDIKSNADFKAWVKSNGLVPADEVYETTLADLIADRMKDEKLIAAVTAVVRARQPDDLKLSGRLPSVVKASDAADDESDDSDDESDEKDEAAA